MDQDRHLRWHTYGERSIYQNRWLNLALADVEAPDGKRFEHHVIRLPRVAIACVIDDHENILTLWRYRFAVDSWGYELIGGIVEDGESPAETAQREVEEESGYRPIGSAELLMTFQPLPGMIDSPVVVFLFRGAAKIGEPTDSEEAARIEWKPVDELLDLALSGELLGSGTIIPVLLYLATRGGRKE